ncbi:fibronectin-binding protein A N-terminus-domain-containing protein, partial [Syncephalis pseudoplumigaleata]
STQYARDKANMPSNFCMKLRKHIRMRRLTNIRQLGTDRIVHFEFLGNEAEGDYHLFVEFYASGNIILTDHAYRIIALLRVVQPNESVRFAVREPYPLHTDAARRDWQPLPADDVLQTDIRGAVQAAGAKDNLKRTLAGLPALADLGPVLVEHAIRVAGLEPQLKVATDFDAGAGRRARRYNEFHPFLCAQHRALPYREFDSFDACVDEFYSRIESQKLETKTVQQELDADKKLSKIKRDQFARASSLAVTQTENERRAELILGNLDLVERAIKYIRHHMECGTDWTLLWRMIQNHPQNKFILGLSAASGKPVKISIDATMTAYANARAFFDQKRQSAVKYTKTMAQADKAFKSAEKKIRQDLRQVKITATINRMRKPFWFEKFMWFISSEGYLVIAGRDMQQNEIIVKRYLRKDDKYVHADLHGAATVVVKNPHSYPPPPSTMFQAGVMSVCQSRAWEAKMLASAYWVNADQVSKTAPSGEYLTTGSFMIRGKRNFLPPVNLVYGFGYLFKIDES